MTKKKTLIILAIVFITIVLMLRVAKTTSHTAEIKNQVPNLVVSEGIEPVQNDNIPKDQVKAPPTSGHADKKETEKFDILAKNFKLETVAEYRKEVEKNGHGPSMAVMAGALRIGDLFDAVTTKEQASQFLGMMGDCAHESKDTPTALKSTCLKYGPRIADRFPELQKDLESIYENADKDAVRIAKVTALRPAK